MVKLAAYLHGTLADYEHAACWYRLAAYSRSADGHYGPGWCYEHGQCVPLDLNKALTLSLQFDAIRDIALKW